MGPLPAGTYGLARQEEAVPTQTEEEAVQPRTEVAALAPAAVPPEVVEPARQTIALAPPQSMPQESAPPASASPPPTPAPRQIDAEELEILKKQAADFIAAGDLISARRIFLRAAEARDAEAALAVGATYDPITIEQFGVRGLKGDIAKAREWYRKAEEFGSTMAAKRLELLAQRER